MESKKGKKRGAKVVEPSMIRFERITELLERENLTRKAFAESLDREPGNVSRILKSKKISEDFIDQVIATYPDYRKEWLLGYDKCPTHTELKQAKAIGALSNAPLTMLEGSYRLVCARENLPVETLSDTMQLAFLVAQLQDYSDFLMWDYVKRKKDRDSAVWNLLESVEESLKRRNNNG